MVCACKAHPSVSYTFGHLTRLTVQVFNGRSVQTHRKSYFRCVAHRHAHQPQTAAAASTKLRHSHSGTLSPVSEAAPKADQQSVSGHTGQPQSSADDKSFDTDNSKQMGGNGNYQRLVDQDHVTSSYVQGDDDSSPSPLAHNELTDSEVSLIARAAASAVWGTGSQGELYIRKCVQVDRPNASDAGHDLHLPTLHFLHHKIIF